MGAGEICIAGGGPAGLAAAIAFRKSGFSVSVFDPAHPPIDKACGEGLLPDGIGALAKLGVEIPAGAGFAFRGIRFVENGVSFAADFPGLPALGLRRTQLHELLMRRAEQMGVALHWGVKPIGFDGSHLVVRGEPVPSQFVVAADGLHSALRRASGLHQPKQQRVRYGFRRHYAVAPWSPYVELHWGQRSQLYITPISAEQVGIAILSEEPGLRLEAALREFPEIGQRIRGVPALSTERGSVTMLRRFRRVCRPGLALIGDASGSVDAITGEGLSLAFRQALLLAQAFERGALAAYERSHRALLRRPERMARLLLALAARPRLRERAFRILRSRTEIFARLLAMHTGQAGLLTFLRATDFLPQIFYS